MVVDARETPCFKQDQACDSRQVERIRPCDGRGHRDGNRVSSHRDRGAMLRVFQDAPGHAELLHGNTGFDERVRVGQWELDQQAHAHGAA